MHSSTAQSSSSRRPSYLDFDKAQYAWRPDVNYRDHPEYYKVGKGEQGVLICEPYKSELVPLWRFKTPDMAADSARRILAQFHIYLKNGEFVGADMARKFLQMGYTRARRYANYKGGRKYDKDKGHAPLERGTGDPLKAKSAEIFFEKWKAAEADPCYAEQKDAWKAVRG
jgi:hypothetical protein